VVDRSGPETSKMYSLAPLHQNMAAIKCRKPWFFCFLS
jgi:hypothetical protein